MVLTKKQQYSTLSTIHLHHHHGLTWRSNSSQQDGIPHHLRRRYHQPYEDYCRTVPQLFPMVFDRKQIKSINLTQIQTVHPRLISYMDLRWYSFDWYATLGLPNEDTTIYVLQYQYGAWVNNNHKTIRLKFDITGDKHIFNPKITKSIFIHYKKYRAGLPIHHHPNEPLIMSVQSTCPIWYYDLTHM